MPPMEEEFRILLMYGSIIAIVISSLLIIFLWVKTKKNSDVYAWILLHFFFVYLVWQFMFNAFNINITYEHPMFSETFTPVVFGAWCSWILSMICLLIGFLRFTIFTKKVIKS